MKSFSPRLAALLVTALTAGVWFAAAAEKPKYTIKEVMKALHKGDDAVGKKVAKGEGTPADLKLMVSYYRSLPLDEPPQGDVKVWKTKATALLKAAEALEAGKPGALDQYKAAVNCKECHKQFKPD